jgi:hypothetical protein
LIDISRGYLDYFLRQSGRLSGRLRFKLKLAGIFLHPYLKISYTVEKGLEAWRPGGWEARKRCWEGERVRHESR